MASDTQSIVQIPNPDECICDIADFDLRHRTMVIQVQRHDYDSGERFYLHFPGVIYFSGPTGWAGAKFEPGSEAQWSALLERFAVVDKTSRYPHLYVVNSPAGMVQLLASSMSISEQP